jgi:DNA-binding response OmpR family regulator
MSVNQEIRKPKILLVEDDINLGFLLVDFLESNGLEVKLYKDGESGFRSFSDNHFDFCILDVMLPKMDGFTLLEKIKTIRQDIPVIILSARSLKEDKIKGFRLGVDDYITKPFDEDELLCRIRAIINRAGNTSGDTGGQCVRVGKYVFDRANQQLQFNSRCQRLTIKETLILSMLTDALNKLVKRDNIMMQVWGDSDYYTGRSLDVFISKLRSYLKEDQAIRLVTIPTQGYILEYPHPELP